MRRLLVSLLTIPLALFLAACGNNGGEAGQGIEVGATAPDFTLPSATGEQVSLADYQGQPVLLYFHMAVG